MPATVTHVLSATTPDNPAYEIRPSHWNSAHAITLNVVATEISQLFSNKNGVSFGLDGTNTTGSIAAGGAPGSISAGTTDFALGKVEFFDSNGVTFGLNGATVTATVRTNYLTTAMASNRGSDFVAATAAFAGTSASGTIASNGISVSIGPYITTAMLSNAVTLSNIRISAGAGNELLSAVTFSNSNGIGFGINGSTITASHNALTTAMASNRGSDFVQATAAFAGTSASGTIASNGISVSIGPYITTAMASNRGSDFVQATAVFNGTNATGTIASGAISVSVAAQSNQQMTMFATGNTTQSSTGTTNASSLIFRGAGVASVGITNGSVVISAPAAAADGGNILAAGTRTAGSNSSVLFSNANGVTFGLDAVNGSIMTASVNAGGGGVLSLSATGNTTQDSTGTFDASSILVAGRGAVSAGFSNGTFQISGPATSSLVGTSGVSISTNGSTISVMILPIAQWEQNRPDATGSTTALQPVGTWWFQPFTPQMPISGGRLNFLTQFGSTSQLPRATTSASFGTATSGQKSMRYQYSLSAALFSLGAGTNSTRMESFWSNQHSFEISHNLSISQAGGASISVSQGITMSGISVINSLGNVTTTTYGGSSTISTASVAMNSTANSSALSSVNNMLSDSLQLPIPFNTTINPGNYFLGVAWSTASSTGGSSQVGFAVVNGVGVLNQTNVTAFRMFGRTATNVSSSPLPGRGQYSVATASPPTTIAFTDIRTQATNMHLYFNYVNSNAISV